MTRIVPKKLEAPPRRRRKWLLLLPLILLFLWWLWPDGRLARARDLQNELFSDSGQGLSPEDRRSKFQELRNVTRGMSDSQRRELSKEMLKRREDDLRRYTQLPPAEKKQKIIDALRKISVKYKPFVEALEGDNPPTPAKR